MGVLVLRLQVNVGSFCHTSMLTRVFYVVNMCVELCFSRRDSR